MFQWVAACFFECSFGASPGTKAAFEKVLRVDVGMTVSKMTLHKKVVATDLNFVGVGVLVGVFWLVSWVGFVGLWFCWFVGGGCFLFFF